MKVSKVMVKKTGRGRRIKEAGKERDRDRDREAERDRETEREGHTSGNITRQEEMSPLLVSSSQAL